MQVTKSTNVTNTSLEINLKYNTPCLLGMLLGSQGCSWECSWECYTLSSIQGKNFAKIILALSKPSLKNGMASKIWKIWKIKIFFGIFSVESDKFATRKGSGGVWIAPQSNPTSFGSACSGSTTFARAPRRSILREPDLSQALRPTAGCALGGAKPKLKRSAPKPSVWKSARELPRREAQKTRLLKPEH